MISRVHHIDFVVRDLAAASARYAALLGREPGSRESLPSRGIEAVRFRLGETLLILVQPIAPGPVQRFLDAHGEGFFHLAYETDDIQAEAARIEASGVGFRDAAVRHGLEGWLLRDLDPSSTFGVECQLAQPARAEQPADRREPAASTPVLEPAGAGGAHPALTASPPSVAGAAAVPEAWLRGPLPGVEPLLMPVAHALTQVGEDLERVLASLPPQALTERPGGAASVAFHVAHVAGSVDRLFTYARGEALSEERRRALEAEKAPPADPAALAALLRNALRAALAQLGATPRERLLEERRVGRAGLPSSVLGLLFHAAEHAQRHTGQALVTARVLAAQRSR
ncbi:MAG: DinB family protein [Vicinamibacteria bacterium]